MASASITPAGIVRPRVAETSSPWVAAAAASAPDNNGSFGSFGNLKCVGGATSTMGVGPYCALCCACAAGSDSPRCSLWSIPYITLHYVGGGGGDECTWLVGKRRGLIGKRTWLAVKRPCWIGKRACLIGKRAWLVGKRTWGWEAPMFEWESARA